MKNLLLCIFVFVTPGFSEAKVKVGFIESFTGADPHTARELHRGAEVFLESDPEAAKNIELIKYDLGGSVGDGAATVQKALKDGVKIFIGAGKSDDAIAIGKLLEGRALFLTPFATNAKVTAGKTTVFRICFSDDSQGEGLAEFASNVLKSENIVVLRNIQSNYSIGLAETFIKKIGRDLPVLEYSGDKLDASALSALIIGKKPNLVFIPDHITRASVIAKAINAKDKSIKFLGGDGFGGQKIFLGVMGDEKNIELTYSTHWHANSRGRPNVTFKKHYSKKFSADLPTSGAAMAFDSMSVLNTVLKEHKYQENVQQLAASIEGKKFDTTVGEITFPKGTDHTPKKPLVFMQFRNGKYGIFAGPR